MMQKVVYIKPKKVDTLLESDDMAILHILMEDYGTDDITDYIDFINERDMPGHIGGATNSDGNTYMKGRQKTKGGKDIHTKKGQLSIAHMAFWRGLVRSAPSILSSCITYGIAGTAFQAIGALHARNEQKWINGYRRINPKAFGDWIATLHDGHKDAQDASVEDASTISYPDDASTAKEQKEKEQQEKAEKIRKKAEAESKVFYVENSNHEVQRIYAFDDAEAKRQAEILIRESEERYRRLNELFKDGAHTYRCVFDDNSVAYYTALDKDAATTEGQHMADALTKLYKTMGIDTVKSIRVKTVTDEGIIKIEVPTVIKVYEQAPDPDKLDRLKAVTYPEFYTNDALKTNTYKLRVNQTSFYFPAESDDQAKLIASGFEKVLLKARGDMLAFITGTTEGMHANTVDMADGDQYTICTTKNSKLSAEEKALRLMADKYDLLRAVANREGGALKALIVDNKDQVDVEVYKTARSTKDDNKITVKFPKINKKIAATVVQTEKSDMPKYFRNHQNISVVLMKNGHEEKEIYSSKLSKDTRKEEAQYRAAK